jgi:hypothetical protein
MLVKNQTSTGNSVAGSFTKLVFEGSTISQLRDAVIELLQLQDYRDELVLDHFDIDWGEWVNITDVRDLPTPCKIRATLA